MIMSSENPMVPNIEKTLSLQLPVKIEVYKRLYLSRLTSVNLNAVGLEHHAKAKPLPILHFVLFH
ncbi:MAG: hypothetical protein NPIRA03_18790 [Nitrospirales bacterium]|nr:MAG: hypothetical protein NPIRA03_18790 [Nitrospirales bacterium]